MPDKKNTDLKLVFISKLGPNYKGEYMYEFIFSEDSANTIAEGWEDNCCGDVSPPDARYISEVGTITLHPEELELEVLIDMEEFAYIDGTYGIIALGWELVADYSQFQHLPEKILAFKFGDLLDDIQDKLYAKDKKLKF